MTRVAIVGALGKMGRLVAAEIASAPDLHLVAAVGRTGAACAPEHPHVPVMTSLESVIAGVDVVMDFSTPVATVAALETTVHYQVAFLTGVTGLSADIQQQMRDAAKTIPVFSATNFSSGLGVLLDVLPRLVRLLNGADIEVIETHHRDKRDAPSGTALSLLAAIQSALTEEPRLVHGRTGNAPRQPGEIGVHSLRGGGNPGEHAIVLATKSEEIRISHRALDRSCFAKGAVTACQWLVNQPPGLYGMTDMVN